MKRTLFILVLLVVLVSKHDAASGISPYAFLSHSAPGKPLQAENWLYQKAGGLDLFGAGVYINPSLLQANLAVFQTNYATAYDVQIGLYRNSLGIYYGKHGAFTKSETHEFMAPQYFGLSVDHEWDALNVRLDAQYGFGLLTRVYNSSIIPSITRYSEEHQNYAVFVVAPQLSYRVINKLHLTLSLGLEKYSFITSSTLSWNIGLVFGDVFLRFFQSSRSINYNVPENDTELIRKPNIYLYPERATQVEVKLAPKGYITTSIPEYGNGWSVWAEPNGRLDETYDFLFYEAKVPLTRPNAGWSVSAEYLDDFFTDILSRYGFNEREIGDFLDYWLPLLNDAPFYEIYPLVNERLDSICPISILPAPDHILRVWVLFTPAQHHRTLTAPFIPWFDKSGFYVTEWGGALFE